MAGRIRVFVAAFVLLGTSMATAQNSWQVPPNQAVMNWPGQPPVVAAPRPAAIAPSGNFPLTDKPYSEMNAPYVTMTSAETTFDPFGWGSQYDLQEALKVQRLPPVPEPEPKDVVKSRRRAIYVRAEAFFLRRESVANTVPFILSTTSAFDPNAGTIVADSNAHFPMSLGSRETVGVELNESAQAEFTYWAVENMHVTQTATGSDTLFFPNYPLDPTDPTARVTTAGNLSFISSDYIGAELATASYNTSLKNFELNVFRNLKFRKFSVFGGYRYMEVRDNLDLAFTNIDTTGLGASGTSDYVVNTLNRLQGAQMGMKFNQDIDLFGIEFIGKAGWYENFAQQSQTVGADNNTIINFRSPNFDLMTPNTGSAHSMSFIGELGLTGSWRASGFCTIRFGYTMLWITNLALAPRQLDFNTLDPTAASLNSVNNRDMLFLHGLNTGLELRF